MEEMALLQKMTDGQKVMFHSEMSRVRKDRTVAILFTFFLGGFGGHHFYMGKTGRGLLYLFFCWTMIPSLVALVELFLMSGRVNKYNDERAHEIAARIMQLGQAPANSQNASAAVA